MSTVVCASLVFGYDLGGPEVRDGWQVNEIDENDFLRLPWFDEEDADLDVRTFADYANDFIAEELGRFSKLTDIPANDRMQVAMKSAGVEVHAAGFDCERYLLITHKISTAPSFVETINFRELAIMQVESAWTSRLGVALKMMGLTPFARVPRWMLVADYD